MSSYLAFILFFALTSLTANVHADNDYPYRDNFSDVLTIESTELEKEYAQVYIIDVRSKLEFDVLHMDKAINIPMSTRGFEVEARKLIPMRSKVVTYCNGHTCKKSYEASQRLSRIGVKHVYTYDAGIFDWTRANPDKTVLLGQSPVDLNNIISEAKFSKHLLNYKDFIAGASTSNSMLLDVRDNFQRNEGITLKGSRFIPLDRFKNWILEERYKDRSLYIFDAAERQVRWLQYYLENQKHQSYYFLKGGADSIDMNRL